MTSVLEAYIKYDQNEDAIEYYTPKERSAESQNQPQPKLNMPKKYLAPTNSGTGSSISDQQPQKPEKQNDCITVVSGGSRDSPAREPEKVTPEVEPHSDPKSVFGQEVYVYEPALLEGQGLITDGMNLEVGQELSGEILTGGEKGDKGGSPGFISIDSGSPGTMRNDLGEGAKAKSTGTGPEPVGSEKGSNGKN